MLRQSVDVRLATVSGPCRPRPRNVSKLVGIASDSRQHCMRLLCSSWQPTDLCAHLHNSLSVFGWCCQSKLARCKGQPEREPVQCLRKASAALAAVSSQVHQTHVAKNKLLHAEDSEATGRTCVGSSITLSHEPNYVPEEINRFPYPPIPSA